MTQGSWWLLLEKPFLCTALSCIVMFGGANAYADQEALSDGSSSSDCSVDKGDSCGSCRRGKRGHRGHRGHQGHRGHTGAVGPTGATGATGATGPAGEFTSSYARAFLSYDDAIFHPITDFFVYTVPLNNCLSPSPQDVTFVQSGSDSYFEIKTAGTYLIEYSASVLSNPSVTDLTSLRPFVLGITIDADFSNYVSSFPVQVTCNPWQQGTPIPTALAFGSGQAIVALSPGQQIRLQILGAGLTSYGFSSFIDDQNNALASLSVLRIQ